MGTVLLATLQGGGNVPPQLGLARRLVARGHRVHVLSEPSVGDDARAAGCDFVPWPTAPAGNAVDRDLALAKDWDMRSPAKVLRFVRGIADFLFGALGRFADDVRRTVDRVDPDVVLVDFALLGALAAAEASARPTVALIPSIYMRPTRGHPVLGSGSLPSHGIASRLRDTVGPAVFERFIDLGLRRLNDVRSRLGLPRLDHVMEALDRCDRVLVMTSPSFDPPPPRLPANVRYVPPVLDDPAWADGDQLPYPPGNDPLVLVALSSTYQAQENLLGRVVTALSDLPVRGLVTLGPGLREGEVQGSANVAVVPSAPHVRVLADAALVITHAGHGSTVKALAAGVPMVCLPHGRDQGDNTARVVARGAGVRLPRSADAERIRATVAQVLADPRFGIAARHMAGVMAAEAARLPGAVDEVEALIAARQVSAGVTSPHS